MAKSAYSPRPAGSLARRRLLRVHENDGDALPLDPEGDAEPVVGHAAQLLDLPGSELRAVRARDLVHGGSHAGPFAGAQDAVDRGDRPDHLALDVHQETELLEHIDRRASQRTSLGRG